MNQNQNLHNFKLVNHKSWSPDPVLLFQESIHLDKSGIPSAMLQPYQRFKLRGFKIELYNTTAPNCPLDQGVFSPRALFAMAYIRPGEKVPSNFQELQNTTNARVIRAPNYFKKYIKLKVPIFGNDVVYDLKSLNISQSARSHGTLIFGFNEAVGFEYRVKHTYYVSLFGRAITLAAATQDPPQEGIPMGSPRVPTPINYCTHLRSDCKCLEDCVEFPLKVADDVW